MKFNFNLNNWKQIETKYIDSNYKEGYERKDGVKVFYTKQGEVTILCEDNQFLNTRELLEILQYAESPVFTKEI